MDFNEVTAKYERIIADAKVEEAEIKPVDIPVVSSDSKPLTAADLPGEMPLTNRLDKMTCEQAIWAIANGTAWIAYLKAHEGEVYQPSAKPVEVSDAEKYQAICDVFESVWLDLTENMKRSYLETDQIPVWVETLQWAIKVLPEGYHSLHKTVKIELETYQLEITKREKEGKTE